MSESDRELLVMAAKAARVRFVDEKSQIHQKSGAFFGLWLEIDSEPVEHQRRYWNPLADDGDALRLSVGLNIAAKYHKNSPPELGIPRECATATNDTGRWFSESGRDPCAATRRAIVRAAAEIGRGMK